MLNIRYSAIPYCIMPPFPFKLPATANQTTAFSELSGAAPLDFLLLLNITIHNTSKYQYTPIFHLFLMLVEEASIHATWLCFAMERSK